MEAPEPADETTRSGPVPGADEPGPLPAFGSVLAWVALASAAVSALSLARGRALADALGERAAAHAVPAGLLGFALGAAAFGLGARRARRPLAALGMLLLGTLGFALLLPAGLEHARDLDASGPVSLLALWLLVGPPAFLAGGALPFAARAIERSTRSPGALILAAAALGAGCGQWVGAFLLVPQAGLDATANVATALGLVLGVLALVLGRGPAWNNAPAESGDEAPPRAAITASAAVLGAAAFALGRLGARELDLVAGPTARTAWAGAAAFAALLGGGALLAACVGRAQRARAAALGGLIAVLAGIAALVAAPALGTALGELALMRTSSAQDAGLLALAALVQGSPALGVGLVFGILAGPGRWAVQRTLQTAALAAVVSALALELGPALERQLELRVALALVPLAVALRFRPGAHPAVAISTLVAAGALALTWGTLSPRDRLLGTYLGGVEAHVALAAFEAAFVAEGPQADVLVLEERIPVAPAESEERRRALFVDGRRVDGTGAPEALAWLPRLLQPGARTALVDGLGTGLVSRALLDLGGIEVTCAEPLDAVLAAAPHFGHIAGGQTPGFTRVAEGLRRHLAGDGPRYDLILVDASAPWTRGATTRLSTEFFQAAGARLEAYGLIAVALPLRSLHLKQLALVVRTATGVFPDAALLVAGGDTALLVLTPRGLLPRAEEVDAAQALLDAAPRASEEIAETFGSADVRTLLLEHLWLGVEPLRAFAARMGDGGIITDSDPALELASFQAALLAARMGDFLSAQSELLFSATDPEFRRQLFIDWRASTPQLEALRVHKTRFFQNRQFEQGLALVQLALTYDPDEPEFAADLLLFGDLDPQRFEAGRRRLLQRSAPETYRLGRSLAQLGRFESARAVLAGLVAEHPGSATALVALAEVLEALGEAQAASEARAGARALDPLNDSVLALDPPR